MTRLITPLQGWLAYLETLHPAHMELGLERVRRVHTVLGAPRPASEVISVAGTNGKGSTVACIESVARAAGRRVGATTSPHLLHFNERLVIDGRAIDDASLIAAFERVEAARVAADVEGAPTRLTYFEFAILAMIDVMSQAELDLAVLEVGLGGRLDAVNIIEPDVAVITGIDLDHQQWLGSDREQIGREKAGILRPGRPAVLGERAPPGSVLERARTLGAHVYRCGEHFEAVTEPSGCWRFEGRLASGAALRIDALPPLALPPAAGPAALQALALLAAPPPGAGMRAGLAMARLAGRMQRVQVGGVEVILDVAHNPQAAGYLGANLEAGRDHIAVFGAYRDKPAEQIVTALAEQVGHWVLCATHGPRGQSGAALHWRVADIPGAERVEVVEPIGAAFHVALAQAEARPGAAVLALGSFQVVGGVLRQLEGGAAESRGRV